MVKQENTSKNSQDSWASLISRDRGPKYLAITKPYDIDAEKEYFKQRFGYPPETEFEFHNKFTSYLFLGPIKEE